MMMSQAITGHGRNRIPVRDSTSIYTSIHPSPALEGEEEGVAICECQTLNLSPQQKKASIPSVVLKAIFVQWLSSGHT